MEASLKDFLDKLDSIETEKLSCYILSDPKVIELEPLNIKQQKELIKQTMHGVKSIVRFTRALNNTVLNSSQNDSLLVCDKAPILVELRKNAIGNMFRGIDLVQISNQYKKSKPNFKFQDKISYKGITIHVCIPTIQYDNTLLSSLDNLIKDGENNSSENLDIVYTYEIIRFIKSVEVDNTIVDFTEITNFKDKSNIFERLPLHINKLVIDFIEQYRAQERELLTTDEGTVDIDVDFFDVE